jgi:hypothetical protein
MSQGLHLLNGIGKQSLLNSLIAAKLVSLDTNSGP